MATILLIGDSITEAFPHGTLLARHTVINKGIFGDNTRLVLERMERDILPQRCDMAFLLIGTNDMAKGFSNGETVRNIERIVRGIRSHYVAPAMFVQSILPTRGLDNRPPERITFLNLQIRRMAAVNGSRYLDIGSLFVNSTGEIPEQYSADGLHLTAEGYEVWGKFLNTIIDAQMHDNR